LKISSLDATEPVAILSDFGISRVQAITITSGILGTPLFLPPEVLKGGKHSKKSDIYALGIVMWMLIMKKTSSQDLFPGAQKAKIPKKAIINGARPPITDHFQSNYATTMQMYINCVF
jgi:serine/threonine protein kinase